MDEEKTKSTFEWTQWVDSINNKIQELYYLEQFDLAKKCEESLLYVKTELEDNNLTNDLAKKTQIVNYLVNLEWEIDQFFKEIDNEQKEKRERKIFQNRINKIIKDVKEQTSDQSFEKLDLILKDSNKEYHNDMAKRRIEEQTAKVVLEILQEQIIRREEINIEETEIFCKQEDLVNAIKTKLIEKAKMQDEEDRIDTLEMAKHLTQEDLKKPNIWRELTRSKRYKNSK